MFNECLMNVICVHVAQAKSGNYLFFPDLLIVLKAKI